MTATKGKDDLQTSVTMRVPLSMLGELKEIAPRRGFRGYQSLIKFYVSEGIRRDQQRFHRDLARGLIDALRERGVPENLLREAAEKAGIE